MATDAVHDDYSGVSKLAKYPFEPYWPEKKLKICVTGAGGFIASHLAKRLKSEGHYIVACDWKRNEHFTVRPCVNQLGLVDGRSRTWQHANVCRHIRKSDCGGKCTCS